MTKHFFYLRGVTLTMVLALACFVFLVKSLSLEFPNVTHPAVGTTAGVSGYDKIPIENDVSSD